MRITLVAANGYFHDRRARALHDSLRAASHDLTVVAAGASVTEGDPDVVTVPTRRPAGPGRVRSRLRRWQSPRLRQRILAHSMVSAVVDSAPDLVLPTTTAALDDAVEAARRLRVPVLADPRWEVPSDVSLIRRAPAEPAAAASARAGLAHHTPSWTPPDGTPMPDRHRGRRVALVYRSRAASPGRYLEDALLRAGVEVLQVDDTVHVDDLPADLDGLVVVESPYPAVEFVGGRPDCPVLFWVHHGEHHLETNVRLAERYGVDHVLLAHSWHLAHRFDVPVTRFPFGVPVHEVDGSRPWADRTHDVAMVGSHLDGGGPYARRGELVARSRDHLGEERCAFRSGITPTAMLAAYADSRIVLNEGGTRHHPITMRVFEAIAAGALLVTDDCPGLDQLVGPEHVAALREPFEAQLDALLADPTSGERAAAALAHARERHTYDHRVDELFAVLDATEAGRPPVELPPASTLAGAVARDSEVQRLVQVGAQELAEAHPDREVWTPDELGDRMQPGTIEGVAIRTEDVTDLVPVLDAAWRYLYVDGAAAGLDTWLAARHPDATIERVGAVRRIDLQAPGYVVRPEVPA